MKLPNIKNKLASIFSIKKLIILSLVILFIIFGTFELIELKKYLDNKNKEDKISSSLELPNEFYDDGYIPSLFINFTAPIIKTESVGKNFNYNIKISPKINGKFEFLSPTYLKFEPKENWKPNTEYKISFNKKTENFKKLNESEYKFKTPINKPYIEEYELYENPSDIKDRKVIATLIFPFPIDDLKNIEKNISLESNDGNLAFSLKTNKTKTEVYLDSESISIKEKEDYIVLSYKIKKEEIKDRLKIPSSNDYFKLNSVSTTTIFNSEKQEEEQVLVLSFTRPANVNDVLNFINLKESTGTCYNNNLKKLNETAKPLKFENLTKNEKFSKIISLKINVPEYSNTCILTSLNGQLISQDGFVFNSNETRVNKAPSFTKEAKVIFDGVIINSNTDKNLTFISRGYDALKVEINRLNENSINHLITQTSGDFKSAYFNNSYSFNEDNISEKFYEIINLNNSNPAKSNYSSIDLKKYIKSKKGIFIVNVNGYDPIKKRTLGNTDRRMIIITDLGILVKSNSNLSKDLFVSSISKGKPISNVKVDVIGKNGIPIITKYTDIDGHILLPSLEKYTNEKKPVAYIVYNEDDASFIPFTKADRELNYSRFDVGGLYQYENSKTSNIKSLIFTDRDLYRPGEDVKIAFILKNENLGYLPSDMPIDIVIRDVRGNEIYEEKTKIGSGFFDLDFKTKSTMPTGEYSIYIYLVNKNGHREYYINSKNFKLEEFQPDKMKIAIKFDDSIKEGWYNDNLLKGEIKLENLFGVPAQNRLIKSTITVNPIKFFFQKYKEYRFTDLWKENIYKTQQIIEERPEEETDNDGIVKFDVDLSKYTSGTYNLSLTAEGFEADGGRSVVAIKNILISPLNYIVGYKTDSDLKYIKKDTKHSIELIAINNKLEKIDITNLKVKLQKISYESILTQESSGRLRYQKEKTYKDISNTNLSISKDGTIYNLPTNIVGDIQISITNEKDNELAIINYTVVGESNDTFSIDKNAELKLLLNKNEFNSGETIEMSITAPYIGYGLITIEKDKVYSYKWFKTNTTNTIQTIEVPNNIEGNAYVNVSFMRDLNSTEIFMSPLSYAVAPFNINKSKFKIEIDLTSPNKVKPGDILKIKYKMNKDSDIVIYGVDEGILQVAKYLLPNPLAEFTKKMALQVYTSQIFDLVLPSFELVKEITGIGGGEGFDEIANNLNPFARKVNKPVSFWSGILRNKTEGTYEYKVPDYFNGKIRIMAIAVGNGAVGSTQTYTNSQADIVITPNVPANISPNDEIDISVGIGNYIENSGKDTEIEITANLSENLKLISEKSVRLKITENTEKTANFSIKALDMLGNADIKFFAKCISKNCNDIQENSIVSTMSLRPSSPYEVFISSGKEKNKTIKDIKEFFKEYNKNELIVSPSPIVLIQGLFDFLSEYPYGCTEQITSKVFPIMIVKSKYPTLVKNENFNKLLVNTIMELAQRQNNNGGFVAWPVANDNYSRETNSFHSLYVMHFLTLAKQNGYYVPQNTFERGINWLKSFVSNNPTDVDDLRNKAYGIYILTLNDILPTANLVSLEKIINNDYKNIWENDTTAIYMAAAYKLMQDDKTANIIIKKFKFQKEKKHYSSFNSNDLKNVQYMYIAGLYFPELFNKIKNESAEILLNIIQENRYNTILSSYSIMALTNFANTIEANSVIFTVKDKNGKEIKTDISDNPFTTLNIQNSGISEVSFKNSESLYFNFIQKGFQKNPSQKAFSKNIDISKRILNLNREEIKEANQGDEVIISLKIQNLTKEFIENVAVVDLLPTGFEIKEVLDSNNVFLKNIREDRFLAYLYLSNDMIEINYRAKLTTKGKLIVPPAFAQDLYNNQNQAQSNGSEFIVK